MTDKFESHKLKGVKLFYSRLATPMDNYSKTGKEFVVTLGVTEEQAKLLTDHGFPRLVMNPITEEKQDRFKLDKSTNLLMLKLKRAARTDEAGEITNTPIVYLAGAKDRFTGNIGNGSIADVDVILTEIKRASPSGELIPTGKKKASIGIVRITELVEFDSVAAAIARAEKEAAGDIF